MVAELDVLIEEWVERHGRLVLMAVEMTKPPVPYGPDASRPTFVAVKPILDTALSSGSSQAR